MFAQQCLADRNWIKFTDKSANGQSIYRGRANNRKIPHPSQRQLQCPRDGGGGKGQHMNVTAQLFQTFLVLHAETLFLINDQQPKVCDFDGFCQNRVGSKNNVNGAIC